MTLFHKLCLAATIGSATFSVASSVPKTIQPDNVILCEPNAGCTSETLFGRDYKVITTPRFTVMVAISREGAYTRADVSVSNNTDTPLSLTPEDFRVEVLTPKPKVLLYIPPARLILPPPPATPAAATPAPQPATPMAAAYTSANVSPATPPATETDVLYAQKTARQEAADKAIADQHLSATSIPPNEVTRGRVYFERDKKAHLVNVVLPIAGLVFEFPYAMKR